MYEVTRRRQKTVFLVVPQSNLPISKVRGKLVAKTNFPTNFRNRNPKRETALVDDREITQHVMRRSLDKIVQGGREGCVSFNCMHINSDIFYAPHNFVNVQSLFVNFQFLF